MAMHEVTINSGDESVEETPKIPATLTKQDAESIKQILRERLQESEDPGIRELVGELETAKARVDSSGELYVGIWKLNREKAQLTRRVPLMREGPVFSVNVSKQTGRWTVGKISVGRLVRR